MPFFRAAILVLLLAAGLCFALYAGTGNPRYKRLGVVIFKWTLLAAVGFFAVLFLERAFA